MATKTAKPAAKKVATRRAVKKATTASATPKPLKEQFTKASLASHVARQAGVEPELANSVLAALEDAILGAVHKKGAGEFTLSGLVKIGVQQVPAKKATLWQRPVHGRGTLVRCQASDSPPEGAR